MAGFLHNGIQDPGPFHLVAPPFPVAGGKGGGRMELVGAHQLLQSRIQKGHTSLLLTLYLPTQSHSHIELLKEAEKQCIPVSSKRGCDFLASRHSAGSPASTTQQELND